MKNSHIEWTDHTFNPWEGCTKVSPGCAHCYAEARNQRFSAGANWGPGAPRRRTSVSNWKGVPSWNRTAICKCGEPELIGSDDCRNCGENFAPATRRRPRVFCASLADWLDDEVPVDWLADLLELIRLTPNLDWLLLTKRPENWERRMRQVMQNAHVGALFAARWLDGNAPENVWIGTTVEDQQRAEERIPELLKIPANVRFLSCEPLLGPVSLIGRYGDTVDPLGHGIHWVICGGESGKGARPMHPDWARSLRAQCAAWGVAFFFKQWGEWLARSQYLFVGYEAVTERFLNGPRLRSAVMRRDGRIDESLGEASNTNDDDSAIELVGKKLGGRLLDGKEHSAFPNLGASASLR